MHSDAKEGAKKGYAAMLEYVKKTLTSPDVMTFEFKSLSGKKFAAVYLDGVTDKALLGELVIKPLRSVREGEEGGQTAMLLASPEIKECKEIQEVIDGILDGNAALFVEDGGAMYVIGLKNPPGRAVTEPPTQVTVKGPREGFTEDIKTNLGLVRKRLKSSDLHIKLLSSGRQSATAVALCYIRGVCREGVPEQIEENIKKNKIDLVPDSSYISSFITKHPRSLSSTAARAKSPISSAQNCAKAGRA